MVQVSVGTSGVTVTTVSHAPSAVLQPLPRSDPGRLFRLINATGRVEMLQNCHWGGDTPYYLDDGSLWCPYHIYRTGADIVPDYLSNYSGAGPSGP